MDVLSCAVSSCGYIEMCHVELCVLSYDCVEFYPVETTACLKFDIFCPFLMTFSF